MKAGPIDTEPKIATCEKCGNTVFALMVNGCRAVVDPAPVPVPALVPVLTTGRALYEAHTVAGRITRMRTSRTLDGPRYASHGCTVSGVVRASEVELPPVGPPRAPVTPGGPLGGYLPPPAPANGSQGLSRPRSGVQDFLASLSSPAAPASPHLSKVARTIKPTRCDICNGIIEHDTKGATSIEHDGRLIWGIHGAC